MSEAARPGGFFRLVRAELLRLRSRRLFAWLALGTLAMLLLTYATIVQPALRQFGFADASPDSGAPFGRSAFLQQVVRGLRLAFLPPLLGLGLVVGSSHVGAEWASRGVTNLLFWEPRRIRVLGAKFVALGGSLAVVSFCATMVLMLILAFGSAGEYVSLPSLVLFALRLALLVAIVSILGATIAAVARSTTASLAAAFVLLAVIEPLLYANVDGYNNIGISFSAARFIDWNPDSLTSLTGLTGPLASGVILLVYAAAFMTIAITYFRKQEMS